MEQKCYSTHCNFLWLLEHNMTFYLSRNIWDRHSSEHKGSPKMPTPIHNTTLFHTLENYKLFNYQYKTLCQLALNQKSLATNGLWLRYYRCLETSIYAYNQRRRCIYFRNRMICQHQTTYNPWVEQDLWFMSTKRMPSTITLHFMHH